MQWFRVYSEIKDDPKMLALTDGQFRIWINLLAMASASKERGIIPKSPLRGLAPALHTSVDELKEALALFQEDEFSLITLENDGDIVINKFFDRQYENPSDRPEASRQRKQEQREREKAQVTSVSRQCHEDVTTLDTDTETEKDINNKNIYAQIAPAEKSAKDGAQQLDCAKTATDNQVSLTVRNVAGKGEYTQEFEEFWSAYPRKVDKKTAFKAWRARLNETPPVAAEVMIQAAKTYAGQCRQEGREAKFIKHGATFIGPSKPYEDYLEPMPGEVIQTAPVRPERFEEFWAIYPRQEQKHKAQQKWDVLVDQGVNAEELVQAAKNYKLSVVGQEARFIKLASTFLGEERTYLDYVHFVPGITANNTVLLGEDLPEL